MGDLDLLEWYTSLVFDNFGEDGYYINEYSENYQFNGHN